MPSLTTGAALLALALTPTSAKSDLDGSVWKALEGGVVISPRQRNRPVERQSGWNPPAELSGALTEVWEHYEKTYEDSEFGNKSWGWDRVVANNGSLNICVRWDSAASVTAAQRAKIADVYAGQSKFIMLASASMEITDFDGWMYRDWWYELSQNRGWTKSPASAGAAASAPAPAAPTVKEDAAERPALVAPGPETVDPVEDSGSESGAAVPSWGQCGGGGYSGATACAAELTCAKTNEWCSQCL